MVKDTKFKRPESVLVVIYNPVAEVLVMRRREPDDFWQSVTGSLREGEVADACACREVMEETAINPPGIINHHTSWTFPILPAWRARYAPEVTENREHVFSLCVEQGVIPTLNEREHTEYQWLPFQQAVERVSSYTNRDAILMLANEQGWPQ